MHSLSHSRIFPLGSGVGANPSHLQSQPRGGEPAIRVSDTREKFTDSNVQWTPYLQRLDKAGNLENTPCHSPGHFREFIDSIKSRKRTLTPVEIAHRSQTPGHLGHIAAITGRKLKWDAAKQEIIGDEAASQLMHQAMRPPWTL